MFRLSKIHNTHISTQTQTNCTYLEKILKGNDLVIVISVTFQIIGALSYLLVSIWRFASKPNWLYDIYMLKNCIFLHEMFPFNMSSHVRPIWLWITWVGYHMVILWFMRNLGFFVTMIGLQNKTNWFWVKY